MPGGDRTGPSGMGPRTGRGLGYCTGNVPPGGAGFGFGGGWWRRGGGFGRGGGRGWRNRNFAGVGWEWRYPVPPIMPEMAKEDEISWLESQAKGLEAALQQVQKQLGKLKD
jgi:hypothetical protein